MTTVTPLHRDWRAREATRAAALADIERDIEQLRRCTTWLINEGVYVVSAEVRRTTGQKPLVTVAPSPLLHILFKDDCAAGQHWDRLHGRTAHDYRAVRHGCEIRWTEVTQ